VWRLEITPTPEYFIWHHSTNVWLILLVGFLLTLIVSIIGLVSCIRQYQVQSLTDKRIEAKQKLEFQAMELIILDAQNRAKEKRANELLIANEEFLATNEELMIANEQLVLQNEEKIKRVAELALSYEQNTLLNRQVNHMQKLESIGRMTSGIAHDFNNILGCILGYNEMNQYVSDDMTDESLKAELENNTKQVDLAVKRAADLINKMLAYCRQDTPKTKMNIQPTQIVIEEVLAMLRPALTSRIKFETVFKSNEIIQIDTMDLHQVLTNLAINARDAMKERGGIITISLKNVTNVKAYCVACATIMEGDFIELSVMDNGTGIESKIISRLFDPFFTTKPQGEGTGLGLSGVSGIVHQSGGHILVESNQSEFDCGTTFKLLFPISLERNGTLHEI
jgi:signal transduction histidine kinase